ncbi:MAG: phosphotransferase [Actinobacteria bacterium]|uniref:Unannotated protein n=1 Tax=freshwater metagenome TaxID=449393 RepID=A0A6J5ZHQ1_9ZZZZ|nr:phosphotransferase [Actinomycetota bacterium]
MIEPIDPPGLVMATLEPWLVDNVAGFTSTDHITAELLSGGRSNISYVLSNQGGVRVVLRRPPLGHVMPSAHDMQREFKVLSGLNKTSYPTPRALAVCEDLQIIGATFMVMSHVAGRVIADASDAQHLSSTDAKEISANLFDQLAALHAINPSDAGLDTLGRPEGYMERQVKRWGEQWQLSQTRQVDEIDVLFKWLNENSALLPNNRPSSIVHGDFRIDNVIIDQDVNEILAVLDWEMATLGDPISDLAISLVYWTRPEDKLRANVPVAQHITDGPGFWTREQIVENYAAKTGFDVSYLDFCVALACFKLAVIMESIHKRNLSGQQLGAASGSSSTMGEATVALAKLGTQTISQGAFTALGS